MKFFKMFSMCAMMVATYVGSANASEEVVLGLENDSGPSFSCDHGYNKKSFNGIDDLARGLSYATGNKLSAVSGDGSFFSGSKNFSVAEDGACRTLFTLNGFKYNGGLDTIIFQGGKRSKPSVKIVGDSADDLQLPVVKCKNILVFRLDVDDFFCERKPSMKSFITDTKSLLEYNSDIQINGKTCNDSGSVFSSGYIVKPGENLLFNPEKCNSCNLGSSEIYVEDLSPALRAIGYWISNVSSSCHAEYPKAMVKLTYDLSVQDIVNAARSGRCGGVSINMKGVRIRCKSHTMKLLRDFAKPEDGTGWMDSQCNDFCNISMES